MLTTILVLFLFFMLFIIFWQGSLLLAAVLGSPIVYANRQAVIDSLELARAKKGDIVIDLGCGSARSLITMVRHFGVKGIGVDRSYYCYLRSLMNVCLSGNRKNIKIIRGDFHKAEKYLKKADIVYLYLLDQTLAQIEDWLFESIGEKTKVVSLAFVFKKHKPFAEAETFTLRRKAKARLYNK
jgi:hypothetical protein